MAKKEGAAAGGFQIFKLAGQAGRIAVNLTTGVAVAEEGKDKLAITVGGVRHVVEAGGTLEEITGADAPEPPEED